MRCIGNRLKIMIVSYFESKGIFNGKAIRPKNGDSLVNVELRDLLEAQKGLQKGTVKGQYGTFFQYNSNVKLEKSEIERNFTKTSLVAIDIDHIKNDLADLIFYNFEEIFENVPGFFACCYSFSHNLHLFVNVESNSIEEFTKNYEDATYTLAFALKCYFNPLEEIGKFLSDETKLGREYKNSEDVFDIHNSSLSQSLDLASSDYCWIENKGEFEDTFVKYGKECINATPKVSRKKSVEFSSKIAKSVVYDKSYFKSSGIEIHTGTIDGLGGNEARMFVASCVKKYFGDEAENVIRSTFSEDINEYISELKTSKAGKIVKGCVEKWCFDNIPAFKGIVTNKINWDLIEDVNLSDELTVSLEVLADKKEIINNGEYLNDAYNRVSLENKAIIMSPCGSGKTYLMKKLSEDKKAILFAPYASIQRLFHKDNINCKNVEAINNSEIKKGTTVYIDEAHLILTDSQYRDKVSKEIEKLIKRDDISIRLFTGTPTKDMILSLKKIGFEYVTFNFSDKNRYKTVKFANIQFLDMTRSIDSILKSVYSVVKEEYKTGNYDNIVICTNKYNKTLQKLGIISPDHFINSDSYRNEKVKEANKRSNVWDFCDGKNWNGIYVMTRYGFAGIDNQDNTNTLYIFFNSESTKTDLIQATNRTRKGNDNVICINDGTFKPEVNKLTYLGLIYFMYRVETANNQICEIGTSTTIEKVNVSSSNVKSLKKAILKKAASLVVDNETIIDENGNKICFVEDSNRMAWNNLKNKEDFYNYFGEFEDIINLRKEIKNDSIYKKVIFRFFNINKKANWILNSRNFKDYREMLDYKFGGQFIVDVNYWAKLTGTKKDMIDKIKGDVINILKDKTTNDINFDENFVISGDFKNYINNENSDLYNITLDTLANNVVEIKRTIEYGHNFDETYKTNNLEEMYTKLVEEEELTQNNAFKTADIDKWFNDTETAEFDGLTITYPIHNDKKDSTGKAVGKAVKDKYCLKSDNSIKFKTREEMYEYCVSNLGVANTIGAFLKKSIWKTYCDKL